jgi:hypothetical protein
MAQTDTRPGFRLPWTGDQGDSTPPPDTTPDATSEPTPETPTETTPDAAAYEAPTPAQEPETPDMIDATAIAGVRRPTKFMVDLSKAMQAAAETARDETLTRLTSDLKVVVEQIHAASTLEAADLRRRADDDVAAVREWSKAEIARIREETEARITLRKTALDGEVENHAGTIASRVESVGATVAEYEARMTSFIERLRAEEDPARIAAMAETMPDPPDLADVAALVAGPAAETEEIDPRRALLASMPALVEEAPADEAQATPEASEAETAQADELPVEADAVAESGPDFAAAEAEAATFTGDSDDDGARSTQVASEHDEADNARLAATADDISAPTERSTTRVVVTGLVSVASIATFKRSLGHVPGVSAIGVASGPDGEFIFTVSHGSGLALSEAITGLPGFEAQVTATSAEGLSVTAHDPDTGA